MAMPVFGLLEIPDDGAGNAVIAGGTAFPFNGAVEKGYEICVDPALAFVADLEGSPTGFDNWTVIAAVAAGQGAVLDRYNFVRVNVTAGGLIGPLTVVRVAGKERS
jgi:hypothetical protein